ncbi:TerC family protein [Paenibacillus sp. IB182496]|uniref:TerC family protein n=1 Tax=Paenibacillus sabuli TaxID=2772509 RepID=A0A927GQM2_9BACL|nr:TerC family protein [Paenibacillus sabuli]MBD2844426.1 TerC family protein [Paenibacillus sabuli]
MDFLSLDFLFDLLNIVFIDLILAGDNAIVIGMAARNLPKDKQKSAIFLGTGGAIGIRIVATILVVNLLHVPWLQLIGGLLLVWIAYKLLVQEDAHGDIKAGATLWASVRTIVIADAAMGLDNVIAVAGAAHGETILVVLGLLISVPVIVWGSTLFIKVMDKLPWIVYIGSGVLAYTASKMITHEASFHAFFDNSLIYWSFIVLVIGAVIAAGYATNALRKRNALPHSPSRESH